MKSETFIQRSNNQIYIFDGQQIAARQIACAMDLKDALYPSLFLSNSYNFSKASLTNARKDILQASMLVQSDQDLLGVRNRPAGEFHRN